MSIKETILTPVFFIDGIIDRIFAVVFAAIFAQFPQFVAQYIQRLAGHVDELARIIGQYKSAASSSGKTLEQFLATHLESGIPDFVNSGKIMESNIHRFSDLSSMLEDLRNANVFNKPFIFIKGLYFDIFKGTLSDYTPGIPVNVEGLVYAFIGLVAGMMIYFGLKRLIKNAFSKE